MKEPGEMRGSAFPGGTTPRRCTLTPAVRFNHSLMVYRDESAPFRVLTGAASVAAGPGRRSIPRPINYLRFTHNH